MRRVIFVFVLMWAGAYAGSAFTENLSGVTDGEPTESKGTIITGTKGGGTRQAANAQRKNDVPFMCKLEGKSCGGSKMIEKTFPKYQSVDLPMDCLRACRNPCLGDDDEFSCGWNCAGAQVVGDKCMLSIKEVGSPCVPTESAGEDLYVPAPPGSAPGECPEGIPAPGFPEDVKSKKYCRVMDTECIPGVDVEKEFEVSARTCQALCTTRGYCLCAFYDEGRICHLRRERCKFSPDPYELAADAGKSRPGTLTIFVLTESEKKKDCPAGSEVVKPPPQEFHPTFCAWPGMICDLPEETDQYYGDKAAHRGFRVGKFKHCLKKCTSIYSCGSAYLITDPDKPNKMSCIMQRLPAKCPKENIVPSDDPKAQLLMRIGKDEATTAQLKDKDFLDKLCQNKSGSDVPWSLSLCGYLDFECSSTPFATLVTGDTKTCLTACGTNEECESVNIREAEKVCELLAEKCYASADDGKVMTDRPGGKYFRKKKMSDAPCPFPKDECYDKVKYVTTKKPGAATCTGEQSCGQDRSAEESFMEPGCRKSYNCGSDGSITEADSNQVDGLCDPTTQCQDVGGEGFCICGENTSYKNGGCA